MKYYVSFQAVLWSGPIFGSFYVECEALDEKTLESWRNNISEKLDTQKETIVFLAIQRLDDICHEHGHHVNTDTKTRSDQLLRHIDDIGRVFIPTAVRKAIGWNVGDKLEVSYSTEDKTVILKKYEKGEEDSDA